MEDIEDLLQSRPLRERGLAQPSTTDTVECEPVPPPDASPPTLTTRWQTPAGWRRFSRRAARTLNLTLGAALGVGAVAIAMGASPGTVETSSPATTASRVVAPVVVESPVVGPAPPVRATARVAIALEHGLKQGRVKIWLDDQVVLDQPLAAATETRSLLLFKKRKATFTEVLEVAPGEHSLRFEVDADGETRSARVRGRLRRDQTRLLAVKVGGNLSLEWKS